MQDTRQSTSCTSHVNPARQQVVTKKLANSNMFNNFNMFSMLNSLHVIWSVSLHCINKKIMTYNTACHYNHFINEYDLRYTIC